jgi:hypothetical protein
MNFIGQFGLRKYNQIGFRLGDLFQQLVKQGGLHDNLKKV